MIARLGRALVIGVLILASLLGVRSGFDDLAVAQTALQKAVTYGGFVHGLLGLAAAAGVVAGKRWALPISAIWGLAVVLVASGATVGYGGVDVLSVATFASLGGSALIAGLVVWGVAKSVRPVERSAASTLTAR
jgi:hypothetical protein